MKELLLYYAEPDPDRWFPGDRVPRRWVRRLVRGRPQPGGQRIVFLNLCAGLDQLGVSYRTNDFRAAPASPGRPVGIVGKAHLLEEQAWPNPILFGASVMSHPLGSPGLLQRHPNIRRILVPGEWMRTMCEPEWGDRVRAWPVGIDTERWSPAPPTAATDIDILIYDKIRWDHATWDAALLAPVRAALRARGLRFVEIRYGHYREEDYRKLLLRCRAMVFLCEHETQGLAYQQALATGVPLLAWDRGGFWQDPEYYPARVQFSPVSSVPYWDDRCGRKFATATEFASTLPEFLDALAARRFQPREYVLENLTLERCAAAYLEHWAAAFGERVPILR